MIINMTKGKGVHVTQKQLCFSKPCDGFLCLKCQTLKKKEVLKIHETSLDRKVVAQNTLITTAKTNCQSCTVHLFFWWLRRSSNLFIHVPVLFCHSPYCIRTTGTPKQPIAWAYCCVCFQPQSAVVVGIPSSVLRREAVPFCRSPMCRDRELGAPLPTPPPFPQSLCCS